MQSEAAQHADFSQIRYAQCWEDADILVEALAPGPGKRCLSICSAGDNTLALLARSPDYVLAIDLSEVQLACLELRMAAYRALQHDELLALIGSSRSEHRVRLYRKCRELLSPSARSYWNERTRIIECGIGGAGKFERYFSTFRKLVLPLIHSQRSVRALLEPKPREERIAFYRDVWDNQRWRTLFRVFFSRRAMGLLGRDPSFFRYVEGSVAGRILKRTSHALTELAPAENPYMHWILTGRHDGVLPFALREENFESIRRNLDKLELRRGAIESLTKMQGGFDCFNLSDIFEYMASENYELELERIVSLSRSGTRLAYWNMLAPRSRPERMAHSLEPLTELSSTLFAQDKAFFYSAFVVEQVR
jgi:S-adenosylmethionine-diacylglycerol 3-amino-3-carboxypropyl transferase